MNAKFKLLFVLIAVFVTAIYFKSSQTVNLTFNNECRNLSSLSQKQQCWEKLIEATLKDKGLDSAFNLVDHLYSSEPQFASDCHDFTHLLGEKAYHLFTQNQNFGLSSKATYCGFGFYHAFMEKLLRTTGDLSQARKFCNYVGKQSGQSEFSRLSCFHGIGHGLLEDTPNPNLKGNDKAIIKTPLSICEDVGKTEAEKIRCASGVFNVIALYYANPKSGLQAKDDDPYLICKSQTKSYFQKPCFDQMNIYVLFKLSQRDLIKAAKFAEDIPEDELAAAAMHGLAGAYGQSNVAKVDYNDVVKVCKNIQPRLKSICIEGFLMGIIEGGKPNIEHLEGVRFCTNDLLNHDEKTFCFNLLTKYYKTANREKLAETCATLKQNYQYNCS